MSTTLDKGSDVGSFLDFPDSHLDDNASISCSISSTVSVPVRLCRFRMSFFRIREKERNTYLRSGFLFILERINDAVFHSF